jgi:uncharacterized protein YndB with AHSA1/START domain
MEKVTVQVIVNASCQDAWKFFTEPEHVMRWNNASPDWHTPKAENNLTVGGRFNFRMESLDGKEGFDFLGTYSEVIPAALIAYSMSDGRNVRVEFTEEEGGTHVVETFDTENENSVEMQRGGWQSILNNFKKYAEERS